MKLSSDIGLLLFRIVIGFTMVLHGINKIFNGVGGIEIMLVNEGIPAFMAYGVYIGEIIAPLLIIVGYKTRIAAFVLAVNMFFAIFLAHAADLFLLNKYGGWAIELQALFLFGSLAIIFTGAGKLAISNRSRWD